MVFSVNEDQKKYFAGIYLMDYMSSDNKKISLYLEGSEEFLEPILEWLLMKEFIEIKNKEYYALSQTGSDELRNFMYRYTEFLKLFDIFCAVDLEEGDFAFSYVDDFNNERAWKNFINEERWDDLRVAVSQFKKINPVEVVFMSFINEKRFGRDSDGWQFDLLLGSVWDEIVNICNNSIHMDELGFDDVPYQEVIKDIVSQGSEIMIEILKSEEPRVVSGIDDDEFLEECIVYEEYYDPYYISPFWHFTYW